MRLWLSYLAHPILHGRRIRFVNLLGTFFKKQFYSKMDKESMFLARYVWIDLELTGLDIKKDTILEISCVVTTPALTPVHEGIDLVIHHDEKVLDAMNDWCKEHHKNSGLIESCKQSTLNLSDASQQITDYIIQHTPSSGTRYLAGNSVYMDRRFLLKDMPKVESLFHYRIIDVSSIKILCSHWYPEAVTFNKRTEHRALSDINNSIEELKHYQRTIFK